LASNFLISTSNTQPPFRSPPTQQNLVLAPYPLSPTLLNQLGPNQLLQTPSPNTNFFAIYTSTIILLSRFCCDGWLPSPSNCFSGGNPCKKIFGGERKEPVPHLVLARVGIDLLVWLALSGPLLPGPSTPSLVRPPLLSLLIMVLRRVAPLAYSQHQGETLAKIFWGGGAGITTLCSPPFSLPPLT